MDDRQVRQFKSLGHLNNSLSIYEEETKTTTKTTTKKDKCFGKRDLNLCKKIQWDIKHVPLDGEPLVVGKNTYACHQGVDKNASAKRNREEQIQKGHRKDDVWRCLVQNTKKKDCPATINVVQLMKFPAYKDIHIVYRPSEEQDDGSVTKLLFCLQTSWQQRLPLLYGQQMCLLDATYRTCRYSVPLFCVRTNVNYVIVGVFVTQSESTSDIKEALQVFKDWNPDWKPSHFMVDFCEADICALEEVFNDSKVILCDFPREKAWTNTNWLTNERLRKWFNTKWLPQAKRWVNVYKTESLKVAIDTNNGVERQSKTLKHTFLEGDKNCSLSELLTVVVSDFLPKAYQKYIELNVMFSDGYRKYNTNLPQYLQNRPRPIAHFRSLDFKGAVTGREKGVFCVKSLTTSATHLVSFGRGSISPSCTCQD
ncbi:hypothetical protein KUCAC02_030074 [Chaenocephalus aceratus]|uniref:Uncharacterized protein n=1 Tax=Chaenocephalus aceratus TaxID=36190 RepID=A0ACB9XIS5_CHAAC|nr:hypothetical protein KUCAC02_030074 [Chaenocephalus aceratus]